MGQVKTALAGVLRYPFLTGVVILVFIAGMSLLLGSLGGVITLGSFTGPENVPRVDNAAATASTASRRLPAPAPEFTLTDQDGRSVTLSELRGKVIVVNFILTRCEEICLQITRELRGLQEHFRTQMGRDLLFLSITVDPDHDGPKALKAYGQKHRVDFTTWHLLTGPRAKIDAVRAGFGVEAQEVKTKTGHVDILHTAKAYIVDRSGTIVDALEPGVVSLFGVTVLGRILESHG